MRYTLKADAALLSGDLTYIINVPIANINTIGNTITAKTIVDDSPVAVSPSTFNTAFTGGGGGYGGERIVRGQGLYGILGGGNDNYIDSSSVQFIPNQLSMTANLVLDPENIIQKYKDQDRKIDLCVTGEGSSLAENSMFRTTTPGWDRELQKNRRYVPLTSPEGGSIG